MPAKGTLPIASSHRGYVKLSFEPSNLTNKGPNRCTRSAQTEAGVEARRAEGMRTAQITGQEPTIARSFGVRVPAAPVKALTVDPT
jgi:hypothetical protein